MKTIYRQKFTISRGFLEESNIGFDEDTMIFLRKHNDYQLSGRYPDYTNKLFKRCTQEFTKEKLEQVKEIRLCLLKMLS
jgi:hypothetical protein